MNILRAGAVLLAIVAATACATAPRPHQIQRAASVSATFDATWSALIDLFAERGWTIATDKHAGLIATGWQAVADAHADCGSAPLAVTHGSSVQFNVRVRPGNDTAWVEVNALFRHLRSFGYVTKLVQCTSNGSIESAILAEVAARVAPRAVASRKAPEPSPAPALDRQAHDARGFYCTTSDTFSECVRDKDTCDESRRNELRDISSMSPCLHVSMSPCRHVDSAFCIPETEEYETEAECAETEDACNRTLDLKMVGAVNVDRSTIGHCVERR